MATLSVFAARFSGEEVAMRFAVDISPAGRWGAPVLLAELAALAEDSGWDGVFCEDYLAFADRLEAALKARGFESGAVAVARLSVEAGLPSSLAASVSMRVDDGRVWRRATALELSDR